MASIVTGDAGHAQRAQLLRMLQFERGYYGDGAPPWEQPDPYRINSPLWSAASVKTPLLLVHGDQDYIPVQQAEEFFTALCTEPRRIPATILLLPPPPRSPANLSKRAADWS